MNKTFLNILCQKWTDS